MFLIGSAGFIHEVIITEGERPTLLLACLALMGVPFFLRKDESDGADPSKPPIPTQTSEPSPAIPPQEGR